MAERLPSEQVPQASRLEKLVLLAQLAVENGRATAVPWPNGTRDLGYYRAAARILGLLDEDDLPTARGRELAMASPSDARRILRGGFEASAVGMAWRSWAGAASLAEVEPSTATQFLAEATELTGETLGWRAPRLATWWIRLFRSTDPIGDAPTPRRRPGRRQLTFDDHVQNRQAKPAPWPWPPHHRFPHNQSEPHVEGVLDVDLRASGELLLVAGYASLERIVDLLGNRRLRPDARIRVLVGHEPDATRDLGRAFPAPLPDEIAEHWLRRGFSPRRSGAVIAALERMDRGTVEARLSPSRRTVHAKLYVADGAVTLGSSNFTDAGLRRSAEANVRFPRSETERYEEARRLAEGLWAEAEPFDGFRELLERLLRRVGWKDALARACAALLEGAWAKRYLVAEELASLEPRLWPHQEEGIAQALWILEHVGSVLVADAAGSGKTRMGAWLLRAAYDRGWRLGQARGAPPVLFAPPQVVERWKDALLEAKVADGARSHGELSQPERKLDPKLLARIAGAEVLAVDEAHNFVSPRTRRTVRLLGHYADHAVLFTATPINRGATDLLALVELLGADHFSDESLRQLKKLRAVQRGRGIGDAELALFREEIRRFTVRRTRDDLNARVRDDEDAYRLENERIARYPAQRVCRFACDAPEADLRLAERIDRLAGALSGAKRLGTVLARPAWATQDEAGYLELVLQSAKALARYHVMATLRSSRAALIEHCVGTAAALEAVGEAPLGKPRNEGDQATAHVELAGKVPAWKLGLPEDAAPRWVVDPSAHAELCLADAERYRRIAALAAEMSDARERAKLEHLRGLVGRGRNVLAFDARVLTLELFHRALQGCGVAPRLLTGGTSAGRRKAARRELGKDGRRGPALALCTDAFSEGINLQAADTVVHLDTPTVIRTAEQRVGRVDRMDSPNDEIEVHWPLDPAAYAPRRRDLLRERAELVSELLGANLVLPEDADAVVDPAQAVEAEREPERKVELGDAFAPVRQLVGAGSLLTGAEYAAHRATKAGIRAAVSTVASGTSWAFFAIEGPAGGPPRWVFFGAPGAAPLTDLAAIAAELRSRLPETTDRPPDEEGQRFLDAFLDRLVAAEWQLLPPRRQRALVQAKAVLSGWASAGRLPRGQAGDVLRATRDLLHGERPERAPDPAAVADVWLEVVGPRVRAHLASRKNRKELWRLNDLTPALLEEPLPLEPLARKLAQLDAAEPIEERVVAAIVGVPAAIG